MAKLSPEQHAAITSNPDLTFEDLSDELYRVYEFPGGDIIRIENPMALSVSKSGGHRILTKDGMAHYIHSGWNHLYWSVRPGAKPFAF